MNFLRSDRARRKMGAVAAFICLSSGQGLPLENALRVAAPALMMMLIAATAREAFAQASPHCYPDPPSQDRGAKEISDVSSDPDAVDITSKDPAAVSASAIVEKIMAENARRSAELRAFQGKRWYHLEYHGLFGGRDASMEVLATYSAPNKRNFSVISQTGSKLLLNRVLLKMLDSEQEAFRNRKQIELSPENYNFTLLDSERVAAGEACYVLAVKPRKQNKFLYSGKIWVDRRDFAVVRMEGEPAKSPSFWIRDTQIDSSWEKVGHFWFIAHNHSVSHIRMGGVATLNIDYGDYQITGVDGRASKSKAQSPILPDPATVAPQR